MPRAIFSDSEGGSFRCVKKNKKNSEVLLVGPHLPPVTWQNERNLQISRCYAGCWVDGQLADSAAGYCPSKKLSCSENIVIHLLIFSSHTDAKPVHTHPPVPPTLSGCVVLSVGFKSIKCQADISR